MVEEILPLKKTNQEVLDLLDLIKSGDTFELWERVKFVGYKIEPDINSRYLIFLNILPTFDYNKNDNFLAFYKQRLNYLKFEKNLNFLTTTDPRIMKKLKNERISPTGKSSKLVKDLGKFTKESEFNE